MNLRQAVDGIKMTVQQNHLGRSTRELCYVAFSGVAISAIVVSILFVSITGCRSELTESELERGRQITVGYSEAEVRKIFPHPPLESPGENHQKILTWFGGGGQLDVYFINGVVSYVDWRREVTQTLEIELQRIIELVLVLLVSAIAITLYRMRRRKS